MKPEPGRGARMTPLFQGRTVPTGRITVVDPETGEKVSRSLRLNPGLVDLVAVSAVPSDEELSGIEAEVGAMAGGKRRQRGGDVSEWVTAKVAFAKAVTLMTLNTFAEIARQAGTSEAAADAKDKVIAYLTAELAPLGDVGKRLATIIVKLVEQVFVKAPVSIAVLMGAGFGYTANFVRHIFQISNAWARNLSSELLSDDKAARAAAAALESVNAAGTTAAVGVFVANQLGILPTSAILAGILVAIQANLGTGAGRAYLVSGLYAWYADQPAEIQNGFKQAAKEYAIAAASTAKESAPVAIANVKTVAAKVNGYLKSKAKGPDAFQSVAAAAAKAAAEAAPAAAPPVVAAASSDVGSPEAVKAASIVMTKEKVVAEAAAVGPDRGAVAAVPKPKRGSRGETPSPLSLGAPFAPGAGTGQGGRRKTKKRSPKRRVTRRKPMRVLGTPVFVY